MDISLLDFYEHIQKYEQIDLMSKFSPYSIEWHFQDRHHWEFPRDLKHNYVMEFCSNWYLLVGDDDSGSLNDNPHH